MAGVLGPPDATQKGSSTIAINGLIFLFSTL